MQAVNEKFLLEKIQRNLEQYGLVVTADVSKLTVSGMDISVLSHTVPAPLGGIDNSVSPFLGTGSVPSFLKIDAKAALASAFVDAEKIKVLTVCARFANTLKIYNGATELMVLEGHPDLKVVGL